MATKQIPFSLEMAKKIQAGEINGLITNEDGFAVEIVSFNGFNTPLPIVVKFSFKDGDNIFFVGNDGVSTKIKLLLKVIDNKPQFKPFDKVLVRDLENEEWKADFFSRYYTDYRYDYECVSGAYIQCIPYEGNEHLLGTTNKPKED